MPGHRLTVTSPSDVEIVMSRAFDAPRRHVWEATISPAMIRRWMFAPPGWTMTVCEMDVRVGGRFTWEWNGSDGRRAITITGVYKEVIAPSRVVHTELMEMGPGGGAECPSDTHAEPWELVAAIDLSETPTGTLLRMTLTFPTKKGRDIALASGMEHGVAAGYDTLDEMLAGAGRKA